MTLQQIKRHFKRNHTRYYRGGPLVALVIIASVLTLSNGLPFKSVEVAFTDAAPSGLAIVPASCPSSPDTGSCGCGPEPTATFSCPEGYTFDGYWCVVSGSSCKVAATCPDGSTAPNGDTAQCSCTSGNTNACVWTTYCTGANDVNGNNWQLWQYSNAIPPAYRSLGESCSPDTVLCPSGYTGIYPNCVAPATCPSGYTGTPPDCVAAFCPSGYTGTPPDCVQSCTPRYICGTDGNLYHEDASCNISSTPTQICEYGCSGSICSAPPAPQVVTFSLKPSLVTSGKTTTVTWNVLHVAGCSVTGTNGDSWTGNTGAQTSSAITGQTIYTLHCSVLTGARNPDSSIASWIDQVATVNIVPKYHEQ